VIVELYPHERSQLYTLYDSETIKLAFGRTTFLVFTCDALWTQSAQRCIIVQENNACSTPALLSLT
jgi:hypothetical protein